MPELRDHYGDGDWYDAEYTHIGIDIPYYASRAAEAKGPVLELACGTGRLTIPMAQAGAEVVGVDVSRPMIETAQTKRRRLPRHDQARLEFREADLRDVRLGRRFAGVILGFNSLMHMVDDADLGAALDTVRAHLAPDGRFHFDVFTPFPALLERDPNGRYDPQEMIEPRTQQRYLVTESNRYDPRSQINTMWFHYQPVDPRGRPSGPEEHTEVRLRVIFPRELDHWLWRHGFAIVGDWDGLEQKCAFSGKGGRRVVAARLESPSLTL